MPAYLTRTLLNLGGVCAISALLAGCYFSAETPHEQEGISPNSSQSDLPAILTFPWDPADGGMAAQVYGTIGLESDCWTVTNDDVEVTYPLAVPESTVLELDDAGVPALNFAHGPRVAVGEFLDSGGGYISSDLYSQFPDVLQACRDAGVDLSEIATTYGN